MEEGRRGEGGTDLIGVVVGPWFSDCLSGCDLFEPVRYQPPLADEKESEGKTYSSSV